MSKIAENKAKDIAKKLESSQAYKFDNFSVVCGAIEGYEQAVKDLLKDANQYMYLSDEICYAYASGCMKTMQAFSMKACEWLSKNARNYYSAYATSDKLIEDFKNYMQMNKQITEDYVSFEIAKLLKEKGFNEPCIGFYNPIDGCFFESIIRKSWNYNRHGSINAPTHQMLSKWLREVHNVYIEVCADKAHNFKDIVFRPAIYSKELNCLWESDNYKTYEEAVEAALKYTLENLI